MIISIRPNDGTGPIPRNVYTTAEVVVGSFEGVAELIFPGPYTIHISYIDLG
jgi:hypothetical protein